MRLFFWIGLGLWGISFYYETKYPFLQGSGKIVRHLYFKSIKEIDKKLICEIIEESLVLNMEANELKILRKLLSQKVNN